jgi:DNA mismatch repair protein MutS2
VHGEALQALELPAILERLAAAAATELGAALARSLAPSAVLDEVGARQALTAEAIVLLDAADDPPLAGVTDIASFVERAERDGVLSPADLRSVSVSARVAVDARRVVHGRRDAVPLLAAIAERVEPSLVQLAEAIDRCVEVDGSDLRDDASPKLRTLRRQLRNGDARLRDELARIARSAGVRDALQESFLAERGGRPVLAVRASSRDQVPGIVHDASGSGQTVFIEPLAVVELGNKLAEAAAEAREEMERILRELSADVASRGDALRALVEAVGELDLAVARGSLSRSWHGAEVQVAGEVRLVGARHPLLDRATAVPIDLDLGELRALVISGPNTGGKTVALKTLGLAALLHQCGLRPPAAEAALPVFDEVLADIGDRQSIEMSLSTFSGHVRTLVAILASATERSLVLLDEVAAGTDPEEGSALAQALVERLAGQARLTVVTTHYGELKEWASARAGVANAATGFDVEADTPLYRLALGRPGTSHALRIAERLGLDPAVVADARSRVAPERLRAAELVAEAESAERAAGERRAEVEETARRVAAREAELERELERVRASAEQARREAVADVERDLAGARAEIAALRNDVRDARRAGRVSDQDRALGAATERAARAELALGQRTVEPLEATAPLAEGDPVEAPDVGVRGTIAAIRGDDAEVVGAAGQRVRIPLARLRPSRERAPEDRRPVVQVRAAARSDVSDQVDVRGRPAHEARLEARRLVDEAALAGLPEVRVVHGRGTGVLRKAVREELTRHPLVERIASDAEDGATVVTLGS